ncbi:MAG: hypothetical protein QW040_03600 [Candidatus Aenigmatarchaeota archaeon]
MLKISNVAIITKCASSLIKESFEYLIKELDIPWYNLSYPPLNVGRKPTVDYTTSHKNPKLLGDELIKRKINRVILAGGHFGACHLDQFIYLVHDFVRKKMDVEFIFPRELIYTFYNTHEADITKMPPEDVIEKIRHYYLLSVSIVPVSTSLIIKLLTLGRKEYYEVYPNCRVFNERQLVEEINPGNKPIITISLFTKNQDVLDYLRKESL